MKKWMEKEYSQWVYYDDEDGKIIGTVYKVGNTQSIWGGTVYQHNIDGALGQYIDSDFAKRAVEYYWEVESRIVIENSNRE